jgi:nucleotide-binding universal stress UspA family protein
MYAKIIVGIDGSETSLNALEHAVKLAEKFDSELVVLSVIDELRLPFSAEFELWARESRDEVLRRILESLNSAVKAIMENRPDVNIDVRIEEGRPAHVITNTAEKENYDLIVVGNRGHGLVEGWILGSVTNEIVNSSKTPVLIIK